MKGHRGERGLDLESPRQRIPDSGLHLPAHLVVVRPIGPVDRERAVLYGNSIARARLNLARAIAAFNVAQVRLLAAAGRIQRDALLP